MARTVAEPFYGLRAVNPSGPARVLPSIDTNLLNTKFARIKAVSDLTDEHRAQVHNYLKATGFRLALLVNFGTHGKLQHERISR
jgi:hypothetical protein